MRKELLFEFKEICCPVCNKNDTKFSGWRGGEAHQNGNGVKTAIVRCRNCTHQYPNPMPFPKAHLSDIYSDAATYFESHNFEKKKSLSLDFMRKFEKKLGRRGRFLDVGCGLGELLWAAQKEGWETEGVDTSEEFVRIGQEKLGVRGHVGTLENVHFPANHFDAIAMSGVVEHLYEPSVVLEEVRRILRPDGVLMLNAPNEDGLYTKFGNLYIKLQGKDWVVVMAPTFEPFHVQGFNPKSLQILLELTGFKIDEMMVKGEIYKQSGHQTLRKKLEYRAAQIINQLGNVLQNGIYIEIWAKKLQKL